MSARNEGPRALSVPMLIGVVVVYLAIVQGVGLALVAGQGYEYGKFPTTESIVRATLVPVALSVAFGAAVASWLGWWGQILREPLRLRLGRWAWIFPALMVVSILIATDYAGLGDVGVTMTLTLLVATLLVGVGEELMFRGITLESMRQSNRTTEVSAALWTAVIFGGAHITNVFTEGPGAFMQALIVAVTGLYIYIARRVSGGLLVPVLLHWGWDFSLFSGSLGADPDVYTLAGVATVTNVVLAVVLVVRRHRIWPAAGDPTPAAG